MCTLVRARGYKSRKQHSSLLVKREVFEDKPWIRHILLQGCLHRVVEVRGGGRVRNNLEIVIVIIICTIRFRARLYWKKHHSPYEGSSDNFAKLNERLIIHFAKKYPSLNYYFAKYILRNKRRPKSLVEYYLVMFKWFFVTWKRSRCHRRVKIVDFAKR